MEANRKKITNNIPKLNIPKNALVIKKKNKNKNYQSNYNYFNPNSNDNLYNYNLNEKNINNKNKEKNLNNLNSEKIQIEPLTQKIISQQKEIEFLKTNLNNYNKLKNDIIILKAENKKLKEELQNKNDIIQEFENLSNLTKSKFETYLYKNNLQNKEYETKLKKKEKEKKIKK